MDVLSIDAGSYSVKFLKTKSVRKRITILNYHEVIISKAKQQFPDAQSEEEIQHEIIKNYLNDESNPGKIIMQIPLFMITTRMLTLPVNNRKKAELMIPFQLDENLPFPTTSAHYITQLKKWSSEFFATINISKIEHFEEFYVSLEKNEILPTTLTTELAVIQSYLDDNEIKGPVCILDIGHHTTKGYFVYDQCIVSTHISYTAGKLLDEVIANTYQISDDEAVTYKHDSCFFLTEQQYESVNSDQKEFAKLMKQAFRPLVLEILRWELGFKVKYIVNTEKILITGGSSNIQNIANFLSQALTIKVEHLDIQNYNKQGEVQLERSQLASFSLVQMMGSSSISKTPLPNFLIGAFSSRASSEIPLHSTFFIASRVLIVSVIIIISLFVERFILSSDEVKLERQISKKIKSNPSLGIRRYKSLLKRNPEQILKQLKKKNQQIQESIKTITEGAGLDSITPLATLSQMISSKPSVDLIAFKSNQEQTTATFYSDKPFLLENMSKQLKILRPKDSFVEHVKGTNNLKFIFKGK